MKLYRTSTLSRKEREDIRLISDQCRREDDLTLSCPEDGDEFWLLEEKGRAAAFIAVYKMDETMWECYGFTGPCCRQKGYFSALLEQLCRWSEGQGEPDLCFVTDHRCPAALNVLDRIGAELFREEYMMEHEIPETGEGAHCKGALSQGTFYIRGRTPDNASPRMYGQNPVLELTVSRCPTQEPDAGCCPAQEPDASRCLPQEPDASCCPPPQPDASCCPAPEPDANCCLTLEPAVSCRLTLTGGAACLFSLETLPALRRRGLARYFLEQLFSLLAGAGCRVLRLQVSGSNTAALKLYEKTGFRITETLSYYLY